MGNSGGTKKTVHGTFIAAIIVGRREEMICILDGCNRNGFLSEEFLPDTRGNVEAWWSCLIIIIYSKIKRLIHDD